jgi:hypothetical protein
MKKKLFFLPLLLLLNGCIESVALLGSTAGGASSGRILQSSLQSSISYGIKKQTGKTPLGHAMAYAEKNNPEKKKETCVSFIEKTRSEFCTIAKKKISSTNKAIKEKVISAVKKNPNTTKPVAAKVEIKPKSNVIPKDLNSTGSFYQFKKTNKEYGYSQ